jgi:hypothetical protein
MHPKAISSNLTQNKPCLDRKEKLAISVSKNNISLFQNSQEVHYGTLQPKCNAFIYVKYSDCTQQTPNFRG